jgi:hypothetical protein
MNIFDGILIVAVIMVFDLGFALLEAIASEVPHVQ